MANSIFDYSKLGTNGYFNDNNNTVDPLMQGEQYLQQTSPTNLLPQSNTSLTSRIVGTPTVSMSKITPPMNIAAAPTNFQSNFQAQPGQDVTYDMQGNVTNVSNFKPEAIGGATTTVSGATNFNDFDTGLMNKLNMNQEQFGQWVKENPLQYREMSTANAQQAYADKLNATPWADYVGAGASALGAGLGVASYFDNKKMQNKRMDALDANMDIAKEEQQHRRDFRNNARSAFA